MSQPSRGPPWSEQAITRCVGLHYDSHHTAKRDSSRARAPEPAKLSCGAHRHPATCRRRRSCSRPRLPGRRLEAIHHPPIAAARAPHSGVEPRQRKGTAASPDEGRRLRPALSLHSRDDLRAWSPAGLTPLRISLSVTSINSDKFILPLGPRPFSGLFITGHVQTHSLWRWLRGVRRGRAHCAMVAGFHERGVNRRPHMHALTRPAGHRGAHQCGPRNLLRRSQFLSKPDVP